MLTLWRCCRKTGLLSLIWISRLPRRPTQFYPNFWYKARVKLPRYEGTLLHFSTEKMLWHVDWNIIRIFSWALPLIWIIMFRSQCLRIHRYHPALIRSLWPIPNTFRQLSMEWTAFMSRIGKWDFSVSIGSNVNERPQTIDGQLYFSLIDNSITELNLRSNFRCYTCIIYCNSGWTVDDGGALRIYMDFPSWKSQRMHPLYVRITT